MGKWIAGIVATVISGVLLAILVPKFTTPTPSPSPPPPPSTPPVTSAPAQVLCSAPTTVQGTSFLDLGSCSGSTSGDVWWEQVDAVRRRLTPQSGTTLANLHTVSFSLVSADRLRSLSYSPVPIDGSNNPFNQLTQGTVVAVKTRVGHYAKVRIDSYGYNLKVTVTTYV
jgi:hypothetical protein